MANELLPKNAIVGANGVPLMVRTAEGEGRFKAVVSCAAKVVLKEGQGLVNIQQKWEIDSEGYRRLNQIAGLSVLTPQNVMVDGHEVGNPHYERNEDTKAISAVIIRKIVMGKSPMGQMVAIDKTLHLDTRAYWNQSLAKLITKYPDAGCLGHRTAQPEVFTSGRAAGKKENKAPSSLAFFAGHAGPDFGVWIDFTHPEVLKLWENHSSMQQFISRRAETTVLRLALQEHPAIAMKKPRVEMVNGEAQATIPVYYQSHGLTLEEQDKLAMQIAVGKNPPSIAVAADVVAGEAAAQELGSQVSDDAQDSPADEPRGEDASLFNKDENIGHGD